MKYGVLYSGSTGNCTFVQIEDKVFLVDAGVSCKKILQGLAVHDISEDMIAGIFLTHEHTDHVIGLKQLVDKRNIPLYGNEKTFGNINPRYRPVNNESLFLLEDDEIVFEELGLKVTALRISHDAKQGSFYIFERNDKKVIYITDTGYVAEKYYPMMQNAHGYIVESNHEPELVLNSKYPWHIQQRILSDKGHLSNQDCCMLLEKIVGEATKFVTLAHLSLENNLPDVALQMASNTLIKEGFTDIHVDVAEPENYACRIKVV